MSSSKRRAAPAKPGQPVKRAKKVVIPGVPTSLTPALLECFKAPFSQSSLAAFMSAARSHADVVHHGVPDYLISLVTNTAEQWDIRLRAVAVLHSLLQRSALCRAVFHSNVSLVVDVVAQKVGVATADTDQADKLAKQVVSLLSDLLESHESQYPRLAVAQRYLQERAGVRNVFNGRQVDAASQIGRIHLDAVRASVTDAVRRVDEERDECESLIRQVEECFEILVPRFAGETPGRSSARAKKGDSDVDDDDDDDDDDDIAWEDSDNFGPSERSAAANSEDERHARELVEAMCAFQRGGMLHINFDDQQRRMELKEGALAGGGNDDEGEDKEGVGMEDAGDEEGTNQDVFVVLQETLEASLASLRNHRLPKVKKWMAAIEECRAKEEETLPVAAIPALHKLVGVKAKIAEVLGKADRFAQLQVDKRRDMATGDRDKQSGKLTITLKH